MFSAATKVSPENFHEVQFYEQDSFLLDALTKYITEGLALGESVLVVATQSHRDALATHLNGDRALIRYLELDAADTLTQFMVNEWPDSEKFHAVMGHLVRQAAASGNGRIRIFGEMVALLWERGRRVAALHLETLWNELAAHQTFSLLCAYPIRGFSSQDHTHDFQKICDTHSKVTKESEAASLHDAIQTAVKKARHSELATVNDV